MQNSKPAKERVSFGWEPVTRPLTFIDPVTGIEREWDHHEAILRDDNGMCIWTRSNTRPLVSNESLLEIAYELEDMSMGLLTVERAVTSSDSKNVAVIMKTASPILIGETILETGMTIANSHDGNSRVFLGQWHIGDGYSIGRFEGLSFQHSGDTSYKRDELSKALEEYLDQMEYFIDLLEFCGSTQLTPQLLDKLYASAFKMKVSDWKERKKKGLRSDMQRYVEAVEDEMCDIGKTAFAVIVGLHKQTTKKYKRPEGVKYAKSEYVGKLEEVEDIFTQRKYSAQHKGQRVITTLIKEMEIIHKTNKEYEELTQRLPTRK